MASSILDDIAHVGELAGHKDLRISEDPQFQLPNALTSEGRRVTGLAAIGRYLSSCNGQDTFSELSRAERAAELQWTEYRTTRVDQCGHGEGDRKRLLEDLNGRLGKSSYLLGHKLGVIDYVVYLGLIPILNRTSLIERDAYPHLGRWFQLVRENWSAKDKQRPSEKERRPIIFSKTPLS